MELYVLRHGIAEEGEPGSPDSARELTSEGRAKTAAVVRMARRSGAAFSLILSSPYTRAVQTARVAAEETGYRGQVLHVSALTPFGSPEAVWDEIRDHRLEPAVLIAGHEPLLSFLVAYLLGVPGLRVEMKKSAMVRIDLESRTGPPKGILRWMITAALAAAAENK